MADINIHREHRLGLAKARKIAWQWAEDVEKKFDKECTVLEGVSSDTVQFTRSGVNGQLMNVFSSGSPPTQLLKPSVL